jgi:hypothetical protein
MATDAVEPVPARVEGVLTHAGKSAPSCLHRREP